ncbi:MAG: hypothetical protein IPM36_15860 [Lewinellaceae bacterium]|nr:hypothetical protein [Lewinellaceae bacterium]
MSANGKTASFEMGGILDSLKGVQGQGKDILQTAAEIEKLLNDGLNWMFKDDRLSGIKDSVIDLLETLRAQPEFIDLDFLKNILGTLKETIEGALGGISIPSFDADLSTVLREMKKVLPEDIPGVDLSDLKANLESIIDKLTDSGISHRVLKDNPALTAVRDSPAATQTGKPPLAERGKSQAQPAAQESQFDKALGDLLTKSELSTLMDPVPGKIDQAMADSGIMLELEEQLTALRNALTNTKPLNMDVVVTELAKVAKALGAMVIDLIKSIIEIIVEVIKKIYDQIQSLGEELSTQIKNTLTQLNLGEIKNVGPFTLPAILLAIPITLVAKITNSDPPDFSGILQDAYDVRQHPKFYGTTQWIDGGRAVVFGSIQAFGLKDDSKYSFGVELASRIGGLGAGVAAQVFSTPEYFHSEKKVESKDFPTQIWEYQLFLLAWGLFGIVMYSINEKVVPKEKRKIWSITEAVFSIAFEIAHLGLFIEQFRREEVEDERVSSTDRRLGVASIIDPLPGIISAVFSLIAMGTASAREPKFHIDAVRSAAGAIQKAAAVSGKKSLGEKLNLQSQKFQANGAIHNAFTAATTLLAPNGAIETAFNRAGHLLTTQGVGTLRNALNNVKTGLNDPTFQNNFNAVANRMDAIGQLIVPTRNAFDAMALDIETLNNSIQKLPENVLLIIVEQWKVEDEFDAADKSLATALGYLDDPKPFLQARRVLAPAQPGQGAPGAGFRAIDPFYNELNRAFTSFRQPFNQKLQGAVQAAQQSAGLIGNLAQALNPLNKPVGSIGENLDAIHTSSISFDNGFNVLLNDKGPNAIIRNIQNLRALRDRFKAELGKTAPRIELLITGNNSDLKQLENRADIMAGTLYKNGLNQLAGYANLLKLVNPGQSGPYPGGVKNIREIREEIADARQQFTTFTADLEAKVLQQMQAVDEKLGSTQTACANFLTFLNSNDVVPNAAQKNTLVQLVQALTTRIQTAKANLNLAGIQQNKQQADNAIAQIEAALNWPAFVLAEAELSENQAVENILNEAAGILAFDQAGDRTTLDQPLELVRKAKQDLEEIKSDNTLNTGALPKNKLKSKVAAIDKGLQNLEKTGSTKQAVRRGSTYAINAIPLVLNLLLKAAYGGLNWWKANYPPPEVELLELMPGPSPKLIAKLVQSKDGTTAMMEVTGIAWHKKDGDGNWLALQNDSADKKEITLSWDDLTHRIRVKLYYAHGYTTFEYRPIALHSDTIEEKVNTSSAVSTGIIHVAYQEGTIYKAANLELLGTDKDFFQIVDVADKPELQLKAGVAIDFEKKDSYQIAIKATDPNKPDYSFTEEFTIKILQA